MLSGSLKSLLNLILILLISLFWDVMWNVTILQAAPTSTFCHFSDLQVTPQARERCANEERRRTWWLFKMWFPSIKKGVSARVRCVVHTERLHVIVFARGTLSFYHKTHSGNRQKRALVVFATWQLPSCARSLFLLSADRSERRMDPFSHSCDQHLHVSFSEAQTHSQQLRVMRFRHTQLWLRACSPGACRMDILVTTFTLSLSFSPCSVPGSSASIRIQHFAVRYGENKKICKKIVV